TSTYFRHANDDDRSLIEVVRDLRAQLEKKTQASSGSFLEAKAMSVIDYYLQHSSSTLPPQRDRLLYFSSATDADTTAPYDHTHPVSFTSPPPPMQPLPHVATAATSAAALTSQTSPFWTTCTHVLPDLPPAPCSQPFRISLTLPSPVRLHRKMPSQRWALL